MWKTWCKYDPDYRVIFDLSEDRNNPKSLDICKQHVVFQHFPMQRLVENPGTWSVHNYKYGQLIALDGNNIDWIYVIKSGEARVFKYLQPNNIDVKARRRKVQALITSQSPFHRKKRILNFVEEREYIKSAYRPATYHPPGGSDRKALHSAPASTSRHTPSLLPRSSVSLPATRQGQRRPSCRKSSSFAQPEKTEIVLPRLVLENDSDQGQDSAEVKDTQATTAATTTTTTATVTTTTTQTVIQETLQELPEDASSARTQSTCVTDGELLHPDPCVTALQPTGNGKETFQTQAADQGDREDPKPCFEDKLGSGFPGKTLAERRLSADLTGSLFEKPLRGGRRQSIFLPPEIPENVEQRRPSILVKPGEGGSRGERMRGRSASFLKTPGATSTSRSLSPSAGNGKVGEKSQVIQVGNHTLPAFVQVETLHPGQVFGLRACLDPEERGPSVSLVSGDCEVLQINKKFFMRHCDDAIYSLIRLKNKPFPSEEDLIDRLDVNMQWEEYKKDTLHSFLKECRSARR